MAVVIASSAALACGGAEPNDETLGETGLAAKNDSPPPGCSSWDQISTDFLEACLLSGGDSIQCSNGDVHCCKSTANGGRTCSTDPDDLRSVLRPGLNQPPLDNALKGSAPPPLQRAQ